MSCYKSKSVKLFSYVTLHIMYSIGGKIPISNIILRTERKFDQERISLKPINFLNGTTIYAKNLKNGIISAINRRCTNNKMEYFHR